VVSLERGNELYCIVFIIFP